MTVKDLRAALSDWNGVYCPPGLPALWVRDALTQLEKAEKERDDWQLMYRASDRHAYNKHGKIEALELAAKLAETTGQNLARKLREIAGQVK